MEMLSHVTSIGGSTYAQLTQALAVPRAVRVQVMYQISGGFLQLCALDLKWYDVRDLDSDPEFQMVKNGGISLAMIWVGNLVPATIISKGFSGASPAFQTTAMRQAQ